MRLKFCLVLATTLFVVASVFSQNNFKSFGSMSLGVKASTFGYGFEAATPLNKLLMLRLGVNLTNGADKLIGKLVGDLNFPLPEDEDFIESFGYMPDLGIKPGINFTHGNLLLDFHPAGIFHITVGAFVGGSKLKVDGRLVDSNNQPSKLLPGKTWPVLEIGAQKQKIDMMNGQARLDVLLGNAVKPYLGLGLGRAVPKKRVSFKFELGAIYQNGYKIKNNGTVLDLKNAPETEVQNIQNNVNKFSKFVMIWPMLNFQVCCRIF